MKNKGEMAAKYRQLREVAKPPTIYFQNLGHLVIHSTELAFTPNALQRITPTGNILSLVEVSGEKKED